MHDSGSDEKTKSNLIHYIWVSSTQKITSTMGNQVLCFGEVLWDAFGDEKKAGGAPMNVARHLVQQHVRVGFASRIGSDASGDELVEFLKNGGLYSNLIQRDNNLPTCEVTVELD